MSLLLGLEFEIVADLILATQHSMLVDLGLIMGYVHPVWAGGGVNNFADPKYGNGPPFSLLLLNQPSPSINFTQ